MVRTARRLEDRQFMAESLPHSRRKVRPSMRFGGPRTARLWASGPQGASCVEKAAIEQLLADLQRAALERLVPVSAPTATGASPGAAQPRTAHASTRVRGAHVLPRTPDGDEGCGPTALTRPGKAALCRGRVGNEGGRTNQRFQDCFPARLETTPVA
jgi:hypothetical protein